MAIRTSNSYVLLIESSEKTYGLGSKTPMQDPASHSLNPRRAY